MGALLTLILIAGVKDQICSFLIMCVRDGLEDLVFVRLIDWFNHCDGFILLMITMIKNS